LDKYDCDTPALFVDLDRMERNIRRMADFAKECDVNLRPHAKTHKIPELARLQLEAGAKGISLQKVSEAEVFADAGFNDIFITNEIVGKQKLQRLASLADKINLAVAVDNPENVVELSKSCSEIGSEVSVFVDIDVGMHRCGVEAKDAAELAALVSKQRGLVFKGVMGYDGHVGKGKTKDERTKLCNEAMDLIGISIDEIRHSAGLEPEVVSVGGSISTWTDAKRSEVTEVQPGMYIFNAINLVEAEVATLDDCALTVLSTVMSKPNEERAIIDAGSKAFHFDHSRFPHLVGLDGSEIYSFSEEHGNIALKGRGKELKIGDKVEAIPYHCCTCVNQHDELIGVRRSRVEKIWKIAARGKMK
jgi:D-serine deaminase-like pyridoxal phosphate-dependent protein